MLASHSKAFFSHVMRLGSVSSPCENYNLQCLRVHDPPSLVLRLTGPESASPVESHFCHFTLWLFIADLRSLAPLADALCFSKQGGFLLLNAE